MKTSLIEGLGNYPAHILSPAAGTLEAPHEEALPLWAPLPITCATALRYLCQGRTAPLQKVNRGERDEHRTPPG